MSRSISVIKKNLSNELYIYQHLFFKLKDVVPVQALNILKEFLLIKTFKVSLIYVLIIIRFKLIEIEIEIRLSDQRLMLQCFQHFLICPLICPSIRVLECEVI